MEMLGGRSKHRRPGSHRVLTCMGSMAREQTASTRSREDSLPAGWEYDINGSRGSAADQAGRAVTITLPPANRCNPSYRCALLLRRSMRLRPGGQAAGWLRAVINLLLLGLLARRSWAHEHTEEVAMQRLADGATIVRLPWFGAAAAAHHRRCPDALADVTPPSCRHTLSSKLMPWCTPSTPAPSRPRCSD